MPKTIQLSLLETPPCPDNTEDWTFNGAATRELTHCYHDYPARMIPQIAGKLLDQFGSQAQTVFDPYSGSGTSLVESNIRGMNAIGTDLNPLARLIATAKTTILNLPLVENYLSLFKPMIVNQQYHPLKEIPSIEGISRLEFWFKPEVIQKLLQLRQFIQSIDDDSTRRFFQVAFSETVRDSSNTRNHEFKLYRYRQDQLVKFEPQVYEIMRAKLQRNLAGYQQYHAMLQNLQKSPYAKIYGFNTVEEIPPTLVPPNSIDMVLTSPPYGDSGTTVAYGQYSRLSAAWLGLEEPDKIDQKLMGNQRLKYLPLLPSEVLNSVIAQINQLDDKRAREVASFYVDLNASIQNVSKLLKIHGYACYVVGNRKVKGLVLPTDMAVKNFFEANGFAHINTFTRAIPNKRMPSKNSPTNAAGRLDSTMTQEYIVVMRRQL